MLVTLAIAMGIAIQNEPVRAVRPQNKSAFFYAGGDPSEIPEVEARGGVYKVGGKPVDPLVAMKRAGFTAIRLRIWNQPKDGFCDLAHTLVMAKRIKQAGLKLMIDFHYSDYWADPGKQYKPAAWKELKSKELEAAVHDYSRDVIKALDDQGTPADVVQPGNEVTNGMLWPEGMLHINSDGWTEFMALNKAAIAGIREGAGKHQPKIMIHIDQGGKNAISRFWFDRYFALGGEADIIGLSYYPFWHGTLQELQANLSNLAKTYKKDILVAETAYPYVKDNAGPGLNPDPVPGFPASPEGQAGYLRKLTAIVKATPGHHGVGVLWWAPAWISAPGRAGGWRRLTLFDNQGEALPGLSSFGPVR